MIFEYADINKTQWPNILLIQEGETIEQIAYDEYGEDILKSGFMKNYEIKNITCYDLVNGKKQKLKELRKNIENLVF